MIYCVYDIRSITEKNRRLAMAVCYDKLWHLLIDRHMSKTQLIKAAKITTNAMAHLGKNEDVRVEVLVKICSALGCTIDEIMEIKSSAEE